MKAKPYHAGILTYSLVFDYCSAFLSSGLKSKERLLTQEEWMSGHVPVIVATISFGMGVDKANVRYVWCTLDGNTSIVCICCTGLWYTGHCQSQWRDIIRSQEELAVMANQLSVGFTTTG